MQSAFCSLPRRYYTESNFQKAPQSRDGFLCAVGQTERLSAVLTTTIMLASKFSSTTRLTAIGNLLADKRTDGPSLPAFIFNFFPFYQIIQSHPGAENLPGFRLRIGS